MVLVAQVPGRPSCRHPLLPPVGTAGAHCHTYRVQDDKSESGRHMIIGVLLGYGEASPVLRTIVRRRGGHSVAGSVSTFSYDRYGDEGRKKSCACLVLGRAVVHYHKATLLYASGALIRPRSTLA